MVPEGWSIQIFENLVKQTQLGTTKRGAEESNGSTTALIKMGNLTWGGFNLRNVEHLSSKKVEANLFLAPGDFLFNTRNTPDLVGKSAVWKGEYGKATFDNNINRITFNDEIDSEYICYYLTTGKGKSIIRSLPAGSTSVAAIYWKDLKKIRVILPPLPEQKKIAQILSTWDQAITATERLLENSQQRKKGLMQQLLTGKKRLPGFEGEWRFISFTDGYSVANQKSAQVKSSEYQISGSIPVIDQGQNEIAGYCEHDSPYTDIPVIIFGDHTRALKWVDFPFCPGADGTQVLKANSILDAKFAYFILSHIELPNLGYSRHMRELKQREFKIPIEMEEQRQIANVLTIADSEIRALSERLALLSQEKKALMQQLLTGKRRVNVDTEAA